MFEFIGFLKKYTARTRALCNLSLYMFFMQQEMYLKILSRAQATDFQTENLLKISEIHEALTTKPQ